MTRPRQILTLENRTGLAADLLAWFAAVKRDLPWRQTDDLYGIWVSEIMLQQTTVKAVIPYWHRFMARFPTVADLATAPESDVLALWSGLGYYSRARNLHAAAQLVCSQYGGRLPSSRDEWLTLPGVGPYAGGAIASIGLAEPVPALDANARRVLMRWAVNDPAALRELSVAQRQRLVDALGAELVPNQNPGTWNEAIMELGALVCRARHADCEACPVRRHCQAWTGQWVADVPPVAKTAKITPAWVGLLLVSWRDRILLLPSQAPAWPAVVADRTVSRADFRGLHQGLWNLPSTPWLAGHTSPPELDSSWRRWLRLPRDLILPDRQLRRIGRFRHAITRYSLRADVWRVELDARQEMPVARLGSGADFQRRDVAAQGLFFALKTASPPVSRLTEKAVHFHLDSVV